MSTVCLCLAVLKNHTDVWFVFLPAAPVETQAPAILALAGLLILLGLLSTALLGHLLCFHIYLSKCPPHTHTPALQEIGVPRLQGGTHLGSRALKSCPFPLLALCGGLVSPHGLSVFGDSGFSLGLGTLPHL